MVSLAIHQTKPAPSEMAGWLQRVLQPVLDACQLDPFSLEIRPTGAWRGWAETKDFSPDGRVCISSKVVFWTPKTIQIIYLHEVAHKLLEGRDVLMHGPEFFAVYATLIARTFGQEGVLNLDLYDCRDQPWEIANDPNWRGNLLNWALQTAQELALTNAPAASLTDIVCQRWQQHLSDLKKARQQAKSAAIRQMEERASAKATRQLLIAIAGIGWLGFLTVSFLIFH